MATSCCAQIAAKNQEVRNAEALWVDNRVTENNIPAPQKQHHTETRLACCHWAW